MKMSVWLSKSFIRTAGVVAFVLVGACTSAPIAAAPTAAPTELPKEKILVVAVDGDVDTFDPCCTVGSKTSQTTIQNTFDQLTQYAQVEKTLPDGQKYLTVDTSKIMGMLAESWEQDGKVVTFRLRKGLKFHNGNPITAQVVVDGYKRIFEQQGMSSFLLTMGSVTKPDQFAALDDLTVKMTMTTENNLVNLNNVMHNTSTVDPLEVQAHKTDTDPWAGAFFKKTLATGSGPFSLEEYVAGDRIVLKAWDAYPAGRAKLDKVIIKVIPDAAQRVLLLKRGEVDMIMVPPIKDLADLAKDPNIKVVSVPSNDNRMVEMNNAIAPFDNKLVRQAVAYAVPYDTLLKEVWMGYAQPLRSPIASGTPTSDFSFWKYNTDLEKAKAKLAEAGFPNGEGLPPIKFSIRIGAEEDERAAVFIQDSLAKIGMKVDIEKLAFAAFQEQEAKRSLQFWIDTWLSWVNDPYYHLSWIYSSTSPLVYTNYKNEEVDSLITKFTLWGGSQEERDAASRRIQELIVDDAPIVYLLAPNFNVAMRSNVSGYVYFNDELNRYYYMDKSQ